MTRHLLHVGFPKAGSTFLQRWFEAHPQLAYLEGGIAGFRDVYAVSRAAAGAVTPPPRYRVTSSETLVAPRSDAGTGVVVDFDRLRGVDVAALQRRACAILSELLPGAVVLIVTRGFRSMILSSYSQYVRSGGDVDLTDLIASSLGGSMQMDDAWHYDQVIAMYRQAFGSENVVVMPYELLREDPARFTTWLAERLGIEPLSGSSSRVNESLSPAEMYWYPRFHRLVRTLRSRRLYERYVRLTFANRLKGPIAVLRKMRPRSVVTPAMIPDEVLEGFRGRAESLREHPLFAAYLREYLLD
ncbi:MAG TPA: hypothetical protein VHW00_17230 [Thermoanaerobaculia bacterium]|nr:hypothetical protein [Thermoanaerobaculia bacterium]